MPFDVFLSYARADGREAAVRIEEALVGHGFSVWRDRRSIDPYQDFSTEIELGIRQSTFIVICVTPSIDCNPDSFVRREIIYAQQLGKPIVPVVLPNALVPTLINHLTWIPFGTGPSDKQRLDFERGLKSLLERLAAGVPSTGKSVLPHDPLRPFLTQLYDQIIEVLNSTVLSLVPLQTVGAPEKVAGRGARARALPVTFLARSAYGSSSNLPASPARFDNLQDAFRQHHGRLLLLGNPGAGKTTTLLAFAREAVTQRLEDPQRPVPIVAPIATWNPDKHLNLCDWLSSIITALNRDAIHRILTGGNVLLLLDGLDELGPARTDDQGERYDPRRRFTELLPSEGNIVVSCRSREYEEIGHKLPLDGAVVLQPLSDSQVANFLRGQPDLLAAVGSDEQLFALARTPLLLSLFAFTFSDLGDEAGRLRDLGGGPSDLRAQVFRAYVGKRIEHETRRWQAAGDPSLTVDVDAVYKVLGALAEHLVRSRGCSELTEWWFQKVVGEASAPHWIELSERLHLILKVGTDAWRFAHLLLRDHFAFEPLVRALKDRDSYGRDRAAEALGEMEDTRAVAPLLERLLDGTERESVRVAAANALATFGDPEIVGALRKVLEEPDSALRVNVVLALGRLGDEQIVEELIECATFEFEPTPYGLGVRRETYDDRRYLASLSANLLRNMDDPRAAKAVRAFEERETWANNREWAEWQEHADSENMYE